MVHGRWDVMSQSGVRNLVAEGRRVAKTADGG